MMIDGIKVLADESVTATEIKTVLEEEKAIWTANGKVLGGVRISVDGEELVVKAAEHSPIKRVRRITGYLSTVDRFNDAKQSELEDRVYHV